VFAHSPALAHRKVGTLAVDTKESVMNMDAFRESHRLECEQREQMSELAEEVANKDNEQDS
jgi:hypothetical protein